MTKACTRCRGRRKRCEVEGGIAGAPCRPCVRAQKASACSLATKDAGQIVISWERRIGLQKAGDPSGHWISPHSPGGALTSKLLSYSLSYHLITLHVKHRPRKLDVGLSIFEWSLLGEDITRVGGRTSELSILEQGVAWMALVDGARLTNHSAIVGATSKPVPEFGSPRVSENYLTNLGTRRRPAIEQLSQQAIEFLDSELYPALSPAEDENKLVLLWLSCSLMEAPSTRKWCRSIMGAVIKLSMGLLKRKNADSASKARVDTLVFYAVLNEIIRSAHYGLTPLTTREEFLSAITLFPHDAPLYTLTSTDLDVLFDPNSPPDSIFAIRTALFSPHLVNFPRAIFDYFYQPDPLMTPIEIVLRMWTFLDSFISSMMEIPTLVETNASYEGDSLEKVAPLMEIVLKALDFLTIAISVVRSCHLKLLGIMSLGKARKPFLGSSQARLYAGIGHLGHFLRMIPPHVVSHQLDEISLIVQDITQLPENGPCSTLTPEAFPSLFEGLKYGSFSSMAAVCLVELFISNESKDSGHFSDGRRMNNPQQTLPSSSGMLRDYTPRINVSVKLRPENGNEIDSDEIASRMVERTLAEVEER